jgi:hypothetical protein
LRQREAGLRGKNIVAPVVRNIHPRFMIAAQLFLPSLFEVPHDQDLFACHCHCRCRFPVDGHDLRADAGASV